MVLPVVKFGDPILRRKGAPVERVDDAVAQFIAHLFDTMYAARGVGLAAQQVGVARQICVIDVRDTALVSAYLPKGTRCN